MKMFRTLRLLMMGLLLLTLQIVMDPTNARGEESPAFRARKCTEVDKSAKKLRFEANDIENSQIPQRQQEADAIDRFIPQIRDYISPSASGRAGAGVLPEDVSLQMLRNIRDTLMARSRYIREVEIPRLQGEAAYDRQQAYFLDNDIKDSLKCNELARGPDGSYLAPAGSSATNNAGGISVNVPGIGGVTIGGGSSSGAGSSSGTGSNSGSSGGSGPECHDAVGNDIPCSNSGSNTGSNTDTMGNNWTVTEVRKRGTFDDIWIGHWTRRGSDNVFNAIWWRKEDRTEEASGVVEVDITGATVTYKIIQGGIFSQQCSGSGRLQPDRRNVIGTMTCPPVGIVDRAGRVRYDNVPTTTDFTANINR